MKAYDSKVRYGWDNLSKFLAVISLPFLFSRSSISLIIGLILLGWSIVRVLSKNPSKRKREEIVFENWSRHANYWLDAACALLAPDQSRGVQWGLEIWCQVSAQITEIQALVDAVPGRDLPD